MLLPRHEVRRRKRVHVELLVVRGRVGRIDPVPAREDMGIGIGVPALNDRIAGARRLALTLSRRVAGAEHERETGKNAASRPRADHGEVEIHRGISSQDDDPMIRCPDDRCYASAMACLGSVRAARSAGAMLPATVISTATAIAIANVTGSTGLTPASTDSSH